jgi:hypothetical protein
MAKKTKQDGIIGTMEGWFANAPDLPKNAREVLVKITPILAVIFGLLGIVLSLGGLGVLTFFAPFAVFGGAKEMSSYGGGFVAALFWFVSSILLFAAFPGTSARKLGGWKLLFWSEMVSFIGSIVTFSIVSGIIGALIGFYLLFQIKSYYK